MIIIIKDGLSESKVYPCWTCRSRVRANSVVCVKRDEWINSRCDAGVKLSAIGVKSVTPRL